MSSTVCRQPLFGDVGELADQDESADQASELYANELDRGLAEQFREELAAVERAEARLAAGTYGSRSRAASRSRTSDSKRYRRPSAPPPSRSATTPAEG